MIPLPEHIAPLARINRYNGWTSRPYVVMEHTLIGAYILDRSGFERDVVRAFLLHDGHEVEFGDIVRPVKRKHLKLSFEKATFRYDVKLYGRHRLGVHLINHPLVVEMDDLMCAVELAHPTLVTRLSDRDFPHRMLDSPTGHEIARLITQETFADPMSHGHWWETLWD